MTRAQRDTARGHLTWAVFLLIGALIEVYAVRSKGRHMSFSEWCRYHAGQHPTRKDKKIMAALLTALLTWFYGHIVFGWGPSLTEDHHLTWRGIYHASQDQTVNRPRA